jgi:Zn-dependent peptidase ImmA (M78 family)
MNTSDRPRPLKEAGRITQMLDHVFGADRFERSPVDVAALALEYSRQVDPKSPIHEVVERNLPGCVGALVYSDVQPRQWAIMYHKDQSPGRRAFTIGHEFGHYVLHRRLIERSDAYDGGIYCDEDSVVRRSGTGLEKEADEFAAALLMPFHDFRRQLPARDRPDFELLSRLAARYGVSLTAVILRWLEYTETRAIMIVSNEGFAHWAKTSRGALRSGRYVRTKDVVFELPAQSAAARSDYSDEARQGIMQPTNVWFPEPVLEMCIRSERYDQEITLLHFESDGPRYQAEEEIVDVVDRFEAQRRSSDL